MIFFFNDTATTEIYTLSLHDALPIYSAAARPRSSRRCSISTCAGSSIGLKNPRTARRAPPTWFILRSEEHTSELQSRQYLVCRLLLEKKTHITARSNT